MHPIAHADAVFFNASEQIVGITVRVGKPVVACEPRGQPLQRNWRRTLVERRVRDGEGAATLLQLLLRSSARHTRVRLSQGGVS